MVAPRATDGHSENDLNKYECDQKDALTHVVNGAHNNRGRCMMISGGRAVVLQHCPGTVHEGNQIALGSNLGHNGVNDAFVASMPTTIAAELIKRCAYLHHHQDTPNVKISKTTRKSLTPPAIRTQVLRVVISNLSRYCLELVLQPPRNGDGMPPCHVVLPGHGVNAS